MRSAIRLRSSSAKAAVIVRNIRPNRRCGIQSLPAHVNQVQGDSGSVPRPGLIQGVYGVSEEAVQFQGDDMLDTLSSDGGSYLLSTRSASQRLRRRDSLLADHIGQFI